jgi:hypothetical protein
VSPAPRSISPYTDAEEREEVQAFCRDRWKKGCLLGDLAREDPSDLTDDEVLMMICAREGALVSPY